MRDKLRNALIGIAISAIGFVIAATGNTLLIRLVGVGIFAITISVTNVLTK